MAQHHAIGVDEPHFTGCDETVTSLLHGITGEFLSDLASIRDGIGQLASKITNLYLQRGSDMEVEAQYLHDLRCQVHRGQLKSEHLEDYVARLQELQVLIRVREKSIEEFYEKGLLYKKMMGVVEEALNKVSDVRAMLKRQAEERKIAMEQLEVVAVEYVEAKAVMSCIREGLEGIPADLSRASGDTGAADNDEDEDYQGSTGNHSDPCGSEDNEEDARDESSSGSEAYWSSKEVNDWSVEEV